MPKKKRVSSPAAKFRAGDKVRVKRGIRDTDYPDTGFTTGVDLKICANLRIDLEGNEHGQEDPELIYEGWDDEEPPVNSRWLKISKIVSAGRHCWTRQQWRPAGMAC